MSTGWYEGMEFRKKPEDCSHTVRAGGYWEDHGPDWDDCTWIDEWDKPTSRDLDLHRYQCTQCGEVRRY